MTVRSEPLVLVADDDPMIRLLCEQSLAPAGFSVVCLPDGAGALKAALELRPDIILLDVRMPGIDGFSICKSIRAHELAKSIPIVMITGNDDSESINRAYELGATDFVSKPIAWAVLPHRIRYLLRASRAFEDLSSAEQKTRALLDTIPDVMLRLDSNGIIKELVCGNSCHVDTFGARPGQAIETFFPADVATEVRERIQVALTTWEVQVYECELDGGKRHSEIRLIRQDADCVLAIVRDITDRRESAAKIHQLAFYDSLTGLPNRQQFVRDLRHAIEASKRKRTSMAVCFVDLDRFKRINDTFGHTVGDTLLRSVAERLKNCIRTSDRVVPKHTAQEPSVRLARLGGDEFVILLTDVKSDEEPSVVAGRVQNALSLPFSFDGHQFVVTPSVGIALYPQDGATVEELLMNADAAMYRAKSAGRNTYRFYSDTMRSRSLERLDLEADLRNAIESKAFCLHYQPKVNIATWSVHGVEALLRWHHPERGWLAPDKFIPLAEETGLIVPLGEWVIHEACSQLARWQGGQLGNVSIAINVSGQQFCHSNFHSVVLDAVRDASIKPHLLELEITESLLMNDVEETISALQSFRKAGLRLSVDDFGTGYSSLAYLKKFPLDSLKIDRSFVRGLHENRDDAAICSAILAMARELGLKVVAEGVEIEAQLEFLRQHSCDEFQGYLFSKPVPAQQLEILLGDTPNEPRRANEGNVAKLTTNVKPR